MSHSGKTGYVTNAARRLSIRHRHSHKQDNRNHNSGNRTLRSRNHTRRQDNLRRQQPRQLRLSSRYSQ